MIESTSVDVDDFTCPICFNYLEVPIFQCSAGHSICSFCKKNIVKCPICNRTFGETRNYALEGIMSKLKMKCSNAPCPEILSVQELSHHVNNLCNFKKRTCCFPNCKWRGSSETVRDHINEYHKSLMVRSNSQLQTHQLTNVVVEFDNHLFLVKRYLEDEIIWTCRAMTVTKEDIIYMLSVQVKTGTGEIFVLKQQCCNEITTPEEQLKGKSIVIMKRSKTKGCKFSVAIEKCTKEI